MPSETVEEYLETIFKLAEKADVRPGMLATELGVAAPTVTATLRRLESHGLVTRTDDGGVVLTDGGRRTAIDIIRRHRIAERFLVDSLGLPWDEVHEEACRLEHALSPRVLEALEAFLKGPHSCPHGHPIPAADGTVAELTGDPLAVCAVGDDTTIVRIDDEDADLLGYLSSLGMLPGEHVRICEFAPFSGPLLVEVGASRYAIGRDVASKIVVTSDAAAGTRK